ncbi:unnamed protein product, partial [Sphacelaria rigidula]
RRESCSHKSRSQFCGRRFPDGLKVLSRASYSARFDTLFSPYLSCGTLRERNADGVGCSLGGGRSCFTHFVWRICVFAVHWCTTVFIKTVFALAVCFFRIWEGGALICLLP